MSKIKEFGLAALKGFGMGAGSVTPSVSAGTIALLTGIYGKIIDSLDSLSNKKTWKALLSGNIKEFWSLINGTFLVALALGFVVSVLSLAGVVGWGLSHYPIITWAFFFGLIIASTVLLLKGLDGLRWTDLIWAAIGIALGVGICCLTPSESPDSLLYIFICGAVSVTTMILPGIAGAFVLQVMGKYEYIINAIAPPMNWPVLGVFALGCVVGLLAFAKFLKWLMGRWERQTIVLLVGFVIGSLLRLWPYHDMEANRIAQELRTGLPAAMVDLQIPGAIISCIAGAVLVAAISMIGRINGRKS